MEDKLKTIYMFLKDNNFDSTLDLFKKELDSSPNIPIKSNMLETGKCKFNSPRTIIHAEREENSFSKERRCKEKVNQYFRP